jgi:dihydroorotate dehydrogenase (fumarate)
MSATANLKTSYLGLELKNPVIAGASDLTANVDKIRAMEDAGAAAIVTKSLFEEQLQFEQFQMEDQANEVNYRHPMMTTVFPDGMDVGPDEHLMWVEKTKNAVSIPVIASLNAVTPEAWVDYAKALAGTGVDALEVNLYASPRGLERPGSDIESEQIAILGQIKEAVDIPISAKLSPFYANPLNVIAAMDRRGVDGFVLFNKLFQPDMNVEKETHIFPMNLSSEGDCRLALRYAGLLHGEISASICSSGGIFSGQDVVKVLLAGADCVQMVSALYRKGIEHIGAVLEELSQWMDGHSYESVSAFQGTLNRTNTPDPWAYTRAQYVKLLLRGNPLERTWPND